MNISELIEARQSVRDFTDKAVPAELLKELQEYFATENQLVQDTGLEMCICTEDAGKRLEGVAGYKGIAFGAPAYAILLTNEGDNATINAGYVGELLALKANDLGLGTCWLTVSDSDAAKRALLLESPKSVAAILALGFAHEEKKITRLDINNPADVRYVNRIGYIAPKIAVEELVFDSEWNKPLAFDEDSTDPLLSSALYAASLAPSFLNRQPYRFVVQGSRVILLGKYESGTTKEDGLLDMGIVMLHFHEAYTEDISGGMKWKLGAPENFSCGAPEDYTCIGYYD